MSHRAALLISLALTLVVAGTIVLARDRLTGSGQETTSVATTGRQLTDQTTSQGSAETGNPSRIVEVSLPASAANALQPQNARADDDWSDQEEDRYVDHDEDDRHDDDDRNDDHDEDDDHEDDDD
jgi:hypothetical protein